MDIIWYRQQSKMFTTDGTPTTNTKTVAQGVMQVAAQPTQSFLQAPEEPNIPYETWIRMYSNLLLQLLGGFSQLVESIRRANFIACLGNEGQRIFFNLEVREKLVDKAKRVVRAHFVAVTCEETQSEALSCGKQNQPQSENLADIDWDCLLSKLLNLLMPISNSQKIPFRTTITLIQMKDIYIQIYLFVITSLECPHELRYQ